MTANQPEARYLADGNVDSVVNALIASEQTGLDLSFEKALIKFHVLTGYRGKLLIKGPLRQFSFAEC